MALISCLDGEERDVLVGLRSAEYWVHSVWFCAGGENWYYMSPDRQLFKHKAPFPKSFGPAWAHIHEGYPIPLDWGPELLCTD